MERNARAICELAGRADVPVYAGCPRPLRGDMISAVYFHGETGLGPVQLPEPAMPLQKTHGVAFTIDLLRQAPTGGVTWCALGPLTNVATALVQAPDIIAGARELVLMGGASRALGNTSPAAEFNILADPHAASIVFDSGLPITMIPLDLTHQVRLSPDRDARIRALGTRVATVVADLLTPAPGRGPSTLPITTAIAYLLAPHLFEGVRVNVAVETQSPVDPRRHDRRLARRERPRHQRHRPPHRRRRWPLRASRGTAAPLRLTPGSSVEAEASGFRAGRIAVWGAADRRMPQEEGDGMIIKEHGFADIATPTGVMRTHLFEPAAAGRYPGLVLYSEIYQITAPVRRMAVFLAGQGYVVSAPEVYHEYEPPGKVLDYDAPGTDRGNALKFEKTVAAYDSDARAALDHLKAYPGCSGRLGAMGI